MTWRDVLDAIFAKQSELMVKYAKIEKLPAPPLALHTTHHQRVMKDFAWRTTEELAEAFASYQAPVVGAIDPHDPTLDELSDVLHFMVEMLIFAGISSSQCADRGFPIEVHRPLERQFWRTTFALGLAMHGLKNKPWKQTPVPTDEGRVRAQLLRAFDEMMRIWVGLGCTPDDVHAYYFRKHTINQQRIEEKY